MRDGRRPGRFCEGSHRRRDRRWLVVALDTTFVIRVRALDGYGHATSLEGLGQMLWASRAQFDARLKVVRLLNVQDEPLAVVLTFKSVRTGSIDLKLKTAGISTMVRLEVVQPR